VFTYDRMVVANAYNRLTQTPSRAATELRASVWTARSLLPLWGTRHTSIAAASCARSKRFALFAALVFMANATILPGEADLLGWNFLFAHSRRAVPAALVMLYQPADMGILPVFVWCMLLLPGFAMALRRWGGVTMVLPVACYAAVWLFGSGLLGLAGVARRKAKA